MTKQPSDEALPVPQNPSNDDAGALCDPLSPRTAALRAACEEASSRRRSLEAPGRRALETALRNELFEATRLLYAIVDTGDCLRAARSFSGEPALHLDRRWELLAAIDKTGGAPTFSDVGRALRITRQAAREIVLAAERAGAVEVFTDPGDRRSLQVMLTPAGRRELKTRRFPPSDWILTLLGGLEPERVRTTARVLDVLRERLRAYEKERRQAAARAFGARPYDAAARSAASTRSLRNGARRNRTPVAS
jgi:DNA-binding MarR family transcriptional regulator